MISNGFYNYHNLKQEYLGGKVKHYPIKDASITLEWYEYIVKANEKLYGGHPGDDATACVVKIRKREPMNLLFGPPRNPDDWNVGDVIRLPKIIVRDIIR